MDHLFSPPLPLMELDDPLPQPEMDVDFDYAAFIDVGQELSTEYLTLSREDSSNSTSTVTPPLDHSPTDSVVAGPSSTTVTTTSKAQQARHAKQRLERRGHTKSRRGCYNCKRRRIKCQETRPACGHCVKTGLDCEYPAAPQIVHQPQHQIPLFSLQDMRLLQHFLMHCHPHHPIGAEAIWTHEIPCLSERHEYLMHAILGLAASDLMQSDPSLVTAAMTHRLKAIRAIKKTLSDVANRSNTFEEGNALMATCFALTFQSVLLDDGMVEFMTFVRGVIIVGIQMYIKGAKLLFGDFLGGEQVEILRPVMEMVPLVDGGWARGAVVAVEGLRGLCKGEMEVGYWERLMGMARELGVSSWGAYKAMSQHYSWWMMLPHDQFNKIIDPDNQVCILLASHWIAVKQIMATITETEQSAKRQGRKNGDGEIEVGMSRWLKHLNGLVDAQHAVYNRWPMWVEAQLDLDKGFFGKTRRRTEGLEWA